MKAENINDLNQLLDRLHAHYSYSEEECFIFGLATII